MNFEQILNNFKELSKFLEEQENMLQNMKVKRGYATIKWAALRHVRSMKKDVAVVISKLSTLKGLLDMLEEG